MASGDYLTRGDPVVEALHEACQVMVHVVEDHVDAALEVVAFVRYACTPASASNFLAQH